MWTGALVCVPITLLCLGIGMVVALRAATRNAEAVADAIKPYETLADQHESNAFEGAGVPPTAPPSLNPTQGTGLALVAGCLFLLSGTAFLQVTMVEADGRCSQIVEGVGGFRLG